MDHRCLPLASNSRRISVSMLLISSNSLCASPSTRSVSARPLAFPRPSFQSSMRAIMRVISGTEVTVVFSIGASDQAGAAQPSNTIRRTGRLDTPSMPVSSSAFPARPPQPSWRIRAMMSRIGMAPRFDVRLVDHLHLAAAIALDAQEPGRERGERLVEGLGAGRQWVGAVAEPVSPGRAPDGHHARSPPDNHRQRAGILLS